MESSDACNPITRAFHGSVRHLINAWKSHYFNEIFQILVGVSNFTSFWRLRPGSKNHSLLPRNNNLPDTPTEVRIITMVVFGFFTHFRNLFYRCNWNSNLCDRLVSSPFGVAGLGFRINIDRQLLAPQGILMDRRSWREKCSLPSSISLWYRQ